MRTSQSLVKALAAVLLLCCLQGARAKRVMFMPMPITSHAVLHANVARALKDLGHEVWLVLGSPVLSKGGFNKEGINVIEFQVMNFDDEVVYPGVLEPLYAGKKPDFGFLAQLNFRMYDPVLPNKTLFSEMKAAKPDLFVVDDDPGGARMFSVFAYKMGVPFACIDFTFEPFARRVPFSPAVTPSYLIPIEQHMTFTERLENTVFYLFGLLDNPLCYSDAVARYAPEMPYISLDTLIARAEIWLLQIDHILDYPKPTLPNVKLIGGIAASPAKPLPSRFQSFMDRAKDGVLIVSFGSLLEGMPDDFGERLFMAAFQQLKKIRVVIKSNLTSPDPEKILTSSWIPQNDLLAHPNTKVFLTHCGMSGQYQALYHAVPMVGLPLFYDQFYNAQRIKAKGFGKVVNFQGLTVSQLVDVIDEVASDPRYKLTITRASTLFREQFGVPAERAAYWLDHVMKYGGSYMRSAGQEIPLYQYLLLDVMAVIGGVVVFCSFLSFVLIRCMIRLGSRKKPKLD
ncbi:hypothetical protein BaRGS_00023559 [Batillaria attramentaria]|uniref:UDP-glucuronosyltransferase n=1 Tax=Batillaria attramentaria TaxID=370345 RepID=A0ABD0KDC2_9CAEN